MRIIRMNCIFRICSNIRRICRIGAYSAATWPSLRLSLIGFRLVDFFSEKIITGPHWVPDPPSLAQMTFTQCTSMSELKIDSGAPPGGQI